MLLWLFLLPTLTTTIAIGISFCKDRFPEGVSEYQVASPNLEGSTVGEPLSSPEVLVTSDQGQSSEVAGIDVLNSELSVFVVDMNRCYDRLFSRDELSEFVARIEEADDLLFSNASTDDERAQIRLRHAERLEGIRSEGIRILRELIEDFSASHMHSIILASFDGAESTPGPLVFYSERVDATDTILEAVDKLPSNKMPQGMVAGAPIP